MARPREAGVPAQFKYQRVKYYPFDVGPADALLLTADPWSYLYAWLTQKRPAKGVRRQCFERALYYAQLAEGFYQASHETELPTKGALAYYGMLNLVKCFISVRGIELEQQYEHHGLTLPHDASRVVAVNRPSDGALGIFHEFARALRTPVRVAERMTIRRVFSNLPEIHEITFSLGLLEHEKRKFLPLRIEFLVNKALDHVFTEVSYEKKNEVRVGTNRFLRGVRADYFERVGEDSRGIVFRSKRRKRVNNDNWPRIYRNICGEYKPFNIVSILSREGYNYYCDLRPGKYHHLCYAFIALFYIGTVARYRPTETRELMESEVRPLVAEAVAICPQQFLYQLVSHTTKSVCVVPHAALE